MGITASTLIYLFMFILTVSTAALADKCFKRKLKVLGIALLVFVILIPSVLAGVRGNDVGRDVQADRIVVAFLLRIAEKGVIDAEFHPVIIGIQK